MKKKNSKVNFILDVIQEKCPNCGEGKVFKQHISLLQLPVMHEKCESCDYHFDREPGYFLGAMYLSYGLEVLQGILTFFILQFLYPSIETLTQTLLVVVVMVLMGRKNYKLSRVLYIHIFPW
jgi:uncharacterized protein (DUF983 family)